MKLQTVITAFALLVTETARAQNCTFDSITPSRDLVWCPCDGQFFCAKLDVPLDYQNPQLGRASVPLLKIPAAPTPEDGPYRGMILFNPGGPGGSGVETARGTSNLLQQALGTSYDIVGFDPRGVGLSEPRPNCSAGILARSRRGRDAPRLLDAYYDEYIDFARELGERCEAQAGAETAAGPHMTTATTARDMLSVVDAFAATPDGARAALNASLLNYYGVSYGSVLGQTFASMFPGRAGRVAVDGVASPEAYQANGTSSNINHLDGVLGAFFVYCHAAGPEACPYHAGDTAADVFGRWNASFARLDARRAQAEGWANATEIAAALVTLKAAMLSAATDPLQQFGPLAEVLVGLEQALAAGGLAAWTEAVNAVIGDPGVAGYARLNPEQSLGVLCSDQGNGLYGKSLEDLRPLIEELGEQSIIGEMWIKAVLGCTGWSIGSGDVFRGPYGGDTAYPMLFVSNTFDPATPIENAIANAPKFRKARRLTVEGIGHVMYATNNQCGFGVIRSYFQGSMCSSEIYCPLEIGPFNVQLDGSIQENVEAAGLSSLRSLY